MLNWVGVLRRILGMYNVKTQQELGMALGVPMGVGVDGLRNEPIPWRILEMVVAEKGVSWDLLLTGKEFTSEDAAQKPQKTTAAVTIANSTPPQRIETREFARVLLGDDKGEKGGVDSGQEEVRGEFTGAENPDALLAEEMRTAGPENAEEGREDDASILRHLEDLKTLMQREIDRVEKILQSRR